MKHLRALCLLLIISILSIKPVIAALYFFIFLSMGSNYGFIITLLLGIILLSSIIFLTFKFYSLFIIRKSLLYFLLTYSIFTALGMFLDKTNDNLFFFILYILGIVIIYLSIIFDKKNNKRIYF